MFKSLLLVAGTLFALVIAYSYYDRQFKLSNIKGNWPETYSARIAPDQLPHLNETVSQPFYYLDRGKQSFVFISQDRKYVLKFFDNRCLRSGMLPFLFSIGKKKCSKKLKRLFEGYQIAQSHDATNAGLLFLQLAADPSNHLQVVVKDRFGLDHVINLSEVPFVIQEKAIPLRQLISSLLEKGNVEEAKFRFRQIIDMYVDEYQHGIFDSDHNFMYNTGFVDNRPLRIDLGRLRLEEAIKDPEVYEEDLEKIGIQRLGDWLERHFPQYRKEILEDMKSKLKEISVSKPQE
ncbi:MAG TPA: hypothetical protein VGP47_03810 [Parachlamydiaceae bacterium]|nr:hypothetical protein [Parachlamydiaceae bacterium]